MSENVIFKLKNELNENLDKNGVVILPPIEVNESINLLKSLGLEATVTMLDPWYNRGIGGVRDDYIDFIATILNNVKDITNHLYLWGFPEIVAQFMNKIPQPLEFVTWLTWYYKNNPSVIRGWRSSQQACLHLSKPHAKLHPENFFNDSQKQRYKQQKMRFIPGPPSVIEEPLLVGFIGKKEKTAHPSQKPFKVYEKLIKMATTKGDLTFDPMCGSGTTGEVCREWGVKAIISDISEEYTQICENRLGIKRLDCQMLRKIIPAEHRTLTIDAMPANHTLVPSKRNNHATEAIQMTLGW
jgi:hypothetical protein